MGSGHKIMFRERLAQKQIGEGYVGWKKGVEVLVIIGYSYLGGCDLGILQLVSFISVEYFGHIEILFAFRGLC